MPSPVSVIFLVAVSTCVVIFVFSMTACVAVILFLGSMIGFRRTIALQHLTSNPACNCKQGNSDCTNDVLHNRAPRME